MGHQVDHLFGERLREIFLRRRAVVAEGQHRERARDARGRVAGARRRLARRGRADERRGGPDHRGGGRHRGRGCEREHRRRERVVGRGEGRRRRRRRWRVSRVSRTQEGRDGGRVGWAIRRSAGEAGRDEGRERIVDGRKQAEIGRRALEPREGGGDRRRSGEGRRPREQLEEHEPERVHVRARVRRAPLDLLGRHVHRRPDRARRAVRGAFVELRPRDAEVREHDSPAAFDEHVRGLEVAVHDPRGMCGREALGDREPDRQRAFGREPPLAREHRLQVRSVDELHREEVLSLGLAEVVRPRDVRVRDAPREPHFPTETLDRGRTRRAAEVERLQRDDVPDERVDRAVHRAHPTPPEQRLDAVAPREERPCWPEVRGARGREEPRVVLCGGRALGVVGHGAEPIGSAARWRRRRASARAIRGARGGGPRVAVGAPRGARRASRPPGAGAPGWPAA